MKPAPFEYIAPQTLQDALTVLNENSYDAKLLAGGQSLIPVMNFRLAQPSMLIDLNGIEGMEFIEPTLEGGVRIGGLTRHVALEHSQLIRDRSPLLYTAVPFIAHPQIRNRGTIGGSLAHADPAAELPVVMVALEAEFCLHCHTGDRWVQAPDFYEGLFTTACRENEIVVEVKIPPRPANTGYAFQELSRRHGDFAQAGVAVVMTLAENGTCQNVRLVFLNVGDIPMMASKASAMFVGQMPTDELIETAVDLAAQEAIEPTTDIHATAAYKRHLAAVLGKRALIVARHRAQDAQKGIPS